MESRHRQLGFSLAMLMLIGCGQEAARTSVESARSLAMDAGRPLESVGAVLDQEVMDLPPDIESDPRGDRYDLIVENPFLVATEHPLSTFSIDVDTASYSKVRQFLTQYHQLPRPDAVRIEELVNYFPYDYAPPTDDQSDPFAVHLAATDCPWNDQHRLLRVAMKGREVPQQERPACNLVLLVDTSGSMKAANKLPLLKRGLQLLVPQLSGKDRIAIVAYAGSAGLVLDSTPANQTATLMSALDRLQSGGSTNGGQGLQLAYQVARDHFVAGGTNRVMLCTDGDFNVGASGTDELVRMIKDASRGGIDLTVLGFGMGNFNDAMLEQVSGHGNGNYAFIDSDNEAKKVLVDQVAGTLVTIAKDVKIQVEFNPNVVSAYRLIGYENRMLEAQDFNDDKKDAGEIGAGHSVTAIYEVIPEGLPSSPGVPAIDPLKYQQPRDTSHAADSGEMLTLKVRYKLPEETESRLMNNVFIDDGGTFASADREFKFAAAVAAFGMLLRDSEFRGSWTYDHVAQIAQTAIGSDEDGLRRELVELVETARRLALAL
ncbi:vWA domain-containing protein [Novipirellula artificiosorum]|uniref:von Willebrand factor n=1 Tax=Novipirellula artificiosorum TaxID=2528016 RepID=A0A5C6DNB5_9BACT|nr:VWA domain-containing protein [Novipirellula artificiosorum]TWU37151.1 von Willebrand factor [Novipirellula artificiosorum]